nr:unnamed protein product [Spirometra erinaceieuropaei]
MDQDSRELQMRQDIAVIKTVAFSVEEVRGVLSQIKPDKSPGPDGIPGLILKELSTELPKPLSTLFELSMRTGRLPSKWKTANLVPLHKGGSRITASSFRPISLTCLPCKTMEALVKSAIQQFCEEHNILQDFQHGFRRGRSCLSNLLACLEIWTRALEEGFEVDIVYIDFRKAFDTVPHQRLLHKLSAIGIRNWIRAFLVGRKQRVCIGDDMSEWVNVTSGVPQGSVLGPLLFILYVNDSLQELDCGKIMFADDVKLWQVIKGPNDQRSLQDNPHRLQAWSKKWLLDFNVEKCAALHLRPTNSHSNESLRTYHLKDVRLPAESSQKDLGVWIQNNLKPTLQCHKAAKNAIITEIFEMASTMREARDRQRESLALSESNPGKSVANIFRHRPPLNELPPWLNDNKVFLIDDTDKAELFSAFFAKHLATESEPAPFFRSLSDRTVSTIDVSSDLIKKHNVNLNPTSEESVERSFQSQIRSRGGHTKPVVVVHPHLKIAHTGQREVPQPPQYSAPPQQGPKVAEHNQFSDCKRSVNEGAPLSATATGSTATPVPTATYPGVSPLTAGLNLLSLAGKVPGNCVAPENAFSSLPYTALHAVPPAQLVNKPPSPAVAEIVLQIVQMDAALTALMIPPGQCAFGLQPLPDEATNTEMTEPEKLFLRWWDTVEKLRGSLLLAFERVILEDLDFCNSAHVEQGMWKSVFYAVLESLRTWQNNPYLTAHAQFADSIKSSTFRTPLLDPPRIDRVDTISMGTFTLMLRRRSSEKTRIRLDHPRFILPFPLDLDTAVERQMWEVAKVTCAQVGFVARHFDAMCYYMRTLAASNPFPTASQSLSALFNEIHVRAVDLMREHGSTSKWPGFGGQKQQVHSSAAAQISSMFSHSRPKRVEIWIHPLDRSVTIVQGNRSLTIPHSSVCGEGTARRGCDKPTGAPSNRDELIEDGNYEEEEEAQAEAEEYSNMSLIEALSGLLAQRPCPLSADRLCQILMVNMFNVDRAAAFTAQSTAAIAAAAAASAAAAAAAAATSGAASGENVRRRTSSSTVTSAAASGEGKSASGLRQRLDADTLRSVHHDHAARFALDTFSLICRRAAKLFPEPRPADAPAFWLTPDLRVLLPALRLWTEWMILHPEHWSPPPNHRDPTLRPFLDDCRLVAGLCTRAAQWLAAQPDRPAVEEITPTTQLVVQLHLRKLAAATAASTVGGDNSTGAATDVSVPPSTHDPTVASPEIEDDSLDGMPTSLTTASAVDTPSFAARASPSKQQIEQQYTHLFEEVVFAGFKPMLDLVPKMYQYAGDFEPDRVSDFIRIEKIVLFGDFLCGIEPPLLSYNTEQRVYESVIERESGEGTGRKEGRALPTAAAAESSQLPQANLDDAPTTPLDAKQDAVSATDKTEDADAASGETGASDDIDALRRKRAALQSQFAEMQRLEAWRQQAVRQASAGGPRGVEIEVRPVYILPDTNCYIDWLEGVSSLAQTSSNYTVLVPIVVLNELDSLATQDRNQFSPTSIESAFAQYLTSSPSTNSETSRASLIQERARAAIAYLETQFDRRNPRLRALTAKGSMLETIAYRHEANRGRQPGQNNDDVILTCCRQFCKEALAQMSAEGHIGPAGSADAKNLPMRLVREVVLLTSDRNLRLKALSLNIPARPLRSFVEWTGLPTPPVGSLSCTSDAHLDPSPARSSTAGGSRHTDHNRWDRRTANK